MEPVDQRHPARPRPGAAGDRLPGRGDLGRLRAGARAAAPPRLGERHRRRPDQHHRRLLPPRRSTRSASSSATTWRPVSPGMKFKVGGKTPTEDAARVRAAREAAGPDFVLMVDANQGYDRAQAVEFARLVWDLDIRWFEEPCRWTNDARWMRDVRYQTGIPVCAGQSETTLRRDPRPHHGRRDRRLELRRLVGRRPDDLAQGGRAGRRVRRPAGPPRGAAGRRRTCWRACPTTPSSSASTRSATRSSGACPTCRRASPAAGYTLPERPGFGIELDWDYVRAHTVATRSSDRSTVA